MENEKVDLQIDIHINYLRKCNAIKSGKILTFKRSLYYASKHIILKFGITSIDSAKTNDLSIINKLLHIGINIYKSYQAYN